MDTGLNKDSFRRLLIFVPIAAGVSLIHVNNFVDTMAKRHVDRAFRIETAASVVKFSQPEKPESSQALQAVVVENKDGKQDLDAQYTAKRAGPIDQAALNRLFSLPNLPETPQELPPEAPAGKPRQSNLANNIRAILRINMLSARGAVINQRSYAIGGQLSERLPPSVGSRQPIQLYLEGVNIKSKSIIIRVGETGQVAEVSMANR